MDNFNDLPAEPNDYMANAYAELAHQAKLRGMKEEEGKLQRLADLYAQRHELTTGERR